MRRRGIGSFRAGVIGIVVIATACYAVFGGSLPFGGSPFVLRAMFTGPTYLHIPSPVRIAGVEVGKVVGVSRSASDGRTAMVTMDIEPNGLPIHADATVLIRARIFLEGNFYVALSPGSPDAPVLASGATLPAANTSSPVQLDRVLSSLQTGARANLQTLIDGLGGALAGAPSPSQDATEDPSVRGLTGGQALNASLKNSADALRASAIVNQALLGLDPRSDLSGVVTGGARIVQGLAESGTALPGFVHGLDLTMAALAARQQQLDATIQTLPGLLRTTDASDTALDASFAPTQTFARRILPGIDRLDATIGAGLPWLHQATALIGDDALGGLLRRLTPAVRSTASSLSATRTLVGRLGALGRCGTRDLVPTGNEVISDPPSSTGRPVYQELFQSFVGVAGAAGNFDGNGRYIRTSAGGGHVQVQSSPIPGYGPMYGNAVTAPLGTRPAFGGSAPPIVSSVPCASNPAPDLNSAAKGAGP